jgi:hypothetical protein
VNHSASGKKTILGRFAVTLWLTTACALLFTCSGEAQEVYRETVLFTGKVGTDVEDLGYQEGEGQALFATTFDVAADGSVWIADPVLKAIKHFSKGGQYLAKINVGEQLVDDICIIDSTRLAVCYWHRDYVNIVNVTGQVLDSCKLPSEIGAMTYLCAHKGLLYVLFYLHYPDSMWNPDGQYRYVGIGYSADGKLLERRLDSLALWTETGGSYFTRSPDAVSGVCLTEILDNAGRTFIKSPTDSSCMFEPLGVDGEDNLYLVRTTRDSEKKYRYVVMKFSQRGEQRAEFEIRLFYRSMGHWAKLDSKGNVYLLNSPQGTKEWSILKYSPTGRY